MPALTPSPHYRFGSRPSSCSSSSCSSPLPRPQLISVLLFIVFCTPPSAQTLAPVLGRHTPPILAPVVAPVLAPVLRSQTTRSSPVLAAAPASVFNMIRPLAHRHKLLLQFFTSLGGTRRCPGVSRTWTPLNEYERTNMQKKHERTCTNE